MSVISMPRATWHNGDPDLAWLIKAAQHSHTYRWQAVSKLSALGEQCYSLWHIKSDPSYIPSGSDKLAHAIVVDPFNGWDQVLESTKAEVSWRSANLPGNIRIFVRSAQQATLQNP